MKPEIYLSSGALAVKNAAAAIEVCQKIGVRSLELASGLACSSGQWQQVKTSSTDMSLILHNYFPAPATPFVLNVASSDKENLQLSLEMAKNAILMSAEVEAPFYSLHAGFAHVLEAGDLGNPDALKARGELAIGQRDAANARFMQSVHLLGDFAATHGIRLLLENNVVAKGSVKSGLDHGLLLVEAQEILDFLADLSHKNVGLLADVGHANVSARSLGFSALEWLEKVMPHVGAFHLSDNDAENDNNQSFDSGSWFMSRVLEKREIPKVIEVYNIDEGEIARMFALFDGD